MESDPHLLTQILAIAALLAATLEYAFVVRHREDHRAEIREREHAANTGLQGLVRVFLTDSLVDQGIYQPE
jgi:hypothetical protein